MQPNHQPDEDRFHAIRPEDVAWKPFASAGREVGGSGGNPSAPGPYVIRVKLPMGTKLMPHQHPEDRVYTVISGVFYIGLGQEFSEERLVGFPPGSVVVLPGGQPHFHFAKSGEYVTQVTAIGPLGLEYIRWADDPRNAQS